MAQLLAESALLDSEPPAGLARAAALARHKEPPARQQQTERTPVDNASSQFAYDSSLMRMRNTT
jgi:hypothetical protein